MQYLSHLLPLRSLRSMPVFNVVQPRYLILLLGLGLSHPSRAQSPAGSDRLVQDRAHVLRPDVVQALEQRLVRYADSSGVQLAVVTWPGLHGQEIAQVGDSLKNALGVGSKKTRQGILYLIAPAEHQQTIRVGRGLEAALPDGACFRILKDTKPTPKANLELAILHRVGAIQRQLSAQASDVVPVELPEPVPSPVEVPVEQEHPIGFVLFLVFALAYAVAAARRSYFANKALSDESPTEDSTYLDRALSGQWRQRRVLVRRKFRGQAPASSSSTNDSSADATLGGYLLGSMLAGNRKSSGGGSASYSSGSSASSGSSGSDFSYGGDADTGGGGASTGW